MDILERKPELKAILGQTGKESEFKALLKGMKPDELVALNHYLSRALNEGESNIWLKQRDVRKVESQIRFLKRDYQDIRSRLQVIQTDLRKSFQAIYKNPSKAGKQCTKWESLQGLIKTGWTLRHRPNIFGSLRGISLFGLFTTKERQRAKETAQGLNYEGMKKSFNEGKKIATWLGHILKGV